MILQTQHITDADRTFPPPRITRSRWPFPIIWIVPLAAAIGAGYYFWRIYQVRGPEIVIAFRDGSGLKTGETPLTVSGVRVGTVTQVDLSPDEQHAMVHVRFYRSTGGVARLGTIFYMVRPNVSGGNISGLSTIVSGPYIVAIPGPAGAPTLSEFTGYDSPPLMLGEGIRVVLHASRLGMLQLDSPVYYRGIQVGNVQDVRLSDDATQVNATLFIWRRFQWLLRANSQFWTLSSFDVRGGLLGGVQVQLGSLRNVLGGGISFATPEKNMGDAARDGTEYTLHDTPDPQWLNWKPRIYLPPPQPGDGSDWPNALQDQTGLRSAIRIR